VTQPGVKVMFLVAAHTSTSVTLLPSCLDMPAGWSTVDACTPPPPSQHTAEKLDLTRHRCGSEGHPHPSCYLATTHTAGSAADSTRRSRVTTPGVGSAVSHPLQPPEAATQCELLPLLTGDPSMRVWSQSDPGNPCSHSSTAAKVARDVAAEAGRSSGGRAWAVDLAARSLRLCWRALRWLMY
jgi:hypothetical protein